MMATKKSTKKAPPRKITAKKGAPKKAAPRKNTPAKKSTAKKVRPTAAASDSKKLSAIDAAAKVLLTSKEPMTTRQMIEAMAAKQLWTSPGGKTPHATLYSAILREIQNKGKDARFKKTERGKFAAAK